jgi:hypothetical protein
MDSKEPAEGLANAWSLRATCDFSFKRRAAYVGCVDNELSWSFLRNKWEMKVQQIYAHIHTFISLT